MDVNTSKMIADVPLVYLPILRNDLEMLKSTMGYDV
jgi:hypothetical protein